MILILYKVAFPRGFEVPEWEVPVLLLLCLNNSTFFLSLGVVLCKGWLKSFKKLGLDMQFKIVSEVK